MADFLARRTAMVDTQVRPSDVTKFPIIEAMLAVPKEDFVPQAQRQAAYVGENISLGGDRVILEARTMGKLLDAVNIQPDETVLDLGCGYGYSSALMSRMAEAVIAVESDEAMAEEAQSILSSVGADNVAVLPGKLAEGQKKHGPYDVIVIEGAVEELPDALLEQLRDGGRIAAIFAEGELGTCRVGHKSSGVVTWRRAFNASAPVIEEFRRVESFAL